MNLWRKCKRLLWISVKSFTLKDLTTLRLLGALYLSNLVSCLGFRKGFCNCRQDLNTSAKAFAIYFGFWIAPDLKVPVILRKENLYWISWCNYMRLPPVNLLHFLTCILQHFVNELAFFVQIVFLKWYQQHFVR